MPDTDTQAPAATAVADLPSASPSGSTAVADRPVIGSPDSFDNIFAKAFAGLPKDDPRDEPVSKAGDATAADETVAAKDAEPVKDTPSADVKAADEPAGTDEAAPAVEGKPLSRRQEVAAKSAARIAELEAQVAALDPATLREQARVDLAAEEARKADEAAAVAASQNTSAEAALYERAVHMADDDPRLYELVADGTKTLYQWREEHKSLLAMYPQAEAHYRAQLAAVQSEAQAWKDGHHGKVMASIGEQIGEAAAFPHVDASTWKQDGTTFADYARSLYEGGAKAKEVELTGRVQKAEAEAARLKKDNEDLRLNLLSGTTAPVTAGRSPSGGTQRPTADPKASWQDNLGAAFGWTT